MYPFFLESFIGDIAIIPTYGLLLAFAFTLCYIDAIHRALKRRLEPRHIENLFLIIVLSSILGSRLFHVLFEKPSYYFEHPIEILYIWQGGFTFYGAFLLAAGISVFYAYRKKLNVRAYADVTAPTIMLGLAIGRIGCFMAGCCWGIPTDLPWGVAFNHPHTFARPLGVPLHPTQLYEAFAAGLIYFYLVHLSKREKYEGQLVVQGLILYPISRFAIEFLRGDDYRGFLGALSTSQTISIFLMGLALALWWKWHPKKLTN